MPRLAHRREVRLTSVRKSPPRTVGLKQLCGFAAEKKVSSNERLNPAAITAIAAETSSTRLKGAVSAPVIDRPARKSREAELLVVSDRVDLVKSEHRGRVVPKSKIVDEVQS